MTKTKPILTVQQFTKYVNLLKTLNVEVIRPEYVSAKLSAGQHIRIYLGMEPSGDLHIGHLATMLPLVYLSKYTNVTAYFLCSEFHALANKKIVDFTGFSRATHLKLLKPSIHYVLSSNSTYYDPFLDREITRSEELTNFMNQPQYFKLVTDKGSNIRFKKLIKASLFFERTDYLNLSITQMLYPFYQAADITYLKIDMAIGGTDQRKIHMLHNDEFEHPITYMHTPLITEDGKKISKTDNTSAVLNGDLRRTYDLLKTHNYINLDSFMSGLTHNTLDIETILDSCVM